MFLYCYIYEVVMKDKSSSKDCLEKRKPDAALPGDMTAADGPGKNHHTDFSDREKKTWCSYMERGFRESRDITDKENV